jgi:hypothetical protein
LDTVGFTVALLLLPTLPGDLSDAVVDLQNRSALVDLLAEALCAHPDVFGMAEIVEIIFGFL